MPTVRCNGRNVCYVDTGGDGPVVVLAHGFALDHTMFAAQRALGPKWRLIAWDARGHGGTPDDGEPFSYWDLAHDLLGLLDVLGVRRAVAGGVSQGGFIALRAALLAPERIGGLVLFDTEANACDPVDRAGYTAMFSALAERGPVDELLVPLAAQIVGEHEAAEEWVARWRVRGLPLGAPVGCLVARDDIACRLGEITCPALLVRGERDGSLPADRMAVLHDGLANASPVHVVAGAWHSPPLTHPGEVNTLLGAFLAAHEPATP